MNGLCKKWRLIIISKKINYDKKLNPIYIESIEANHIYINDSFKETDKKVEYKVGKDWVEFKKIKTRKAVLTDSLFLRYMRSSLTVDSSDRCMDFIVVKFNYSADYKIDGVEGNVNKHDLRMMYYKDGVTYTFIKKNKHGEIVNEHPIHYKMLMRSTGKAKKGGVCIYTR